MRYIIIIWLSILILGGKAHAKLPLDSIVNESAVLDSTTIITEDSSGVQGRYSGYSRSDTITSLTNVGNVDKLDFNFDDIFLWVIISLLLLNLVFSVFLQFKMIKKNKNMDINELNEKFNKFCKEIEDRITELRYEIEKNRTYIDQKLSDRASKDDKPLEGNKVNLSLEIMPLASSKEICYAYSSVDGYFVDLMKDMSNAIAYFKLELENDQGKYMIIDNDNPEMQKQMVTDGYPNIAPCVEEQNSRNEWKSGIETVAVGKVTKDERGWKISKKTIISYK